MHKRVSVFNEKSSYSPRVSVFYQALNHRHQVSNFDSGCIKSELTEWWRVRFPVSKKSENAEPADKLFATLKKLYAYSDRLHLVIRQHVCQAIHEHVGLHPENSVARTSLLLDMPHLTGRECIAAQAFRTYLQHEIWPDHAHVAVFEKLNVAAKGQGFARITAMRDILAAESEIAARLQLGFSLFVHMQLDAQSVSSAFRGSDAEPGFLRGATRETVGVLLRHFSLVFSDASLTSDLLGTNPTHELEEAFLSLRQLPVTPAAFALLKTLNVPMITLLKRAEYLDSEALSGVATALNALDTTIDRGYNNRRSLIECIVDHVLCPDAKTPLSTLIFAKKLDIEAVKTIAHTLTEVGLKEHSFSFSQKLLFAKIELHDISPIELHDISQIALREISDSPVNGDQDTWPDASQKREISDSPVDGYQDACADASQNMSYFEIWGEHLEEHASRTSGLSRLSSLGSTASDQVSERPIQQGLVRYAAIRGAGFWSDDEFSVESEASAGSLTPSEQEFRNSLLAKRERIEERIRNEVRTYNQAIEDRVFFAELICFLRDICLPPAFTNDRRAPFAGTLGVAKNVHTKQILREAAHAITEKCDLNPTQQKEAQRILDTVFGKQASEATPWDRLVLQSRVSASELRFLFGLPTLPTKVDNAKKMYAVLSALGSLENSSDFKMICQMLNLSEEESVSQRLSTVGHHVSDLLLSTGLTMVETQALTKLRKFYGDSTFRILTRAGALSAAIGLMPKEAVALRSLLSQDHPSFKHVRDIFVYSGHGARFDVDSGYQNIPVISFRTVAQDALRLRNVHLQIYEAALNDLLTRQMGNDDRGLILHEISVVQRDMGTPLMVEDLSGSSKATKASLKSSLGKKGNLAGTRERMTTLLSQMVSDELRAISPKAFLQEHTKNRLNIQNRWDTKRFDVGDTTSVIVPANAAASGKIRNRVMDARGYTGISCQYNATWHDAAANNQMTELWYDGSLIFSGVRHAIVATQPTVARTAAQLNRVKAKDLLRSAILQKLIQNQTNSLDLGSPLDICLVSISLVTPDDLRPFLKNPVNQYHEKQMLQEQCDALRALAGLSEQEKTALLSEFQDEEGQPLWPDALPTLTVTAHTFNFGVNEREYGGRRNQRDQNHQAMNNFIIFAHRHSDNLISSPLWQYLPDFLRTTFDVYETMGLFDSKQPQPYAVPVMIAALAQMKGASVLFNCKSGKDRTGLFDVMVKIYMRYLYKHQNQDQDQYVYLNYFNRLEEAYVKNEAGGADTDPDTEWLYEEQRFNREMLFNSGNREVQEENTTAWGYKLEGANTARMFDVVFGIKNMAEVYGFSQLIKA